MVANEKKGLQESPEGLEPRVYEIGYLLIPSVREEDLDKEREALLALITNLKGEIISEGKPELIRLGYEMDKITENKKQTYSNGYFGWAKFNIDPELLEKLEEKLKKEVNLLRYLLIKSNSEDMPFSEKPLASILAKQDTSADEKKDEEVLEDEASDELDEPNDIDLSDEIPESDEVADDTPEEEEK